MSDTNRTSSIVLEEGKAFSQCALWRLQRDFFIREGVNAWDHQVPFYITSNPSIANGYATMMLRFMQDWSRSAYFRPDEPFYILELGAGSGRFGFYALKRLLEIKAQLDLDDIQFVYVLTDFAETNIDYWIEHPAWQPYVEQGLVDFACFDVENDRQLRLRQSGKTLGGGVGSAAPQNPCLVVANYLLDSLRHDIFRVTDGDLYAALTCLRTDEENIKTPAPGQQQVHVLDRLEVDFSYEKIVGEYYEIDVFDQLLEGYKNRLDDAHFIFPIGGLRCLENLKSISQGFYLMLAADKGDCELSDLAYSEVPGISLHGSCSLQVNFHALAQYLHNEGGDSIKPVRQPGISSIAFVSGTVFSDLPETRRAVDDYLGRYSPATLFKLYAYVRDTVEHCPPETFLALMHLTDWDPHIFNKYIDTLLSKLPNCSRGVVHALKEGMPKIANNFYYIPGAIDTLSGIALFFQELEDYEQALDYYRQSTNYYGEAYHIHYNCGLCHYYLNDNELALKQFERALELYPDFDFAQHWRNKLQVRLMQEARGVSNSASLRVFPY